MKRIVRSLTLLFLAGFAGFAHASECGSLASMSWLVGYWRLRAWQSLRLP